MKKADSKHKSTGPSKAGSSSASKKAPKAVAKKTEPAKSSSSTNKADSKVQVKKAASASAPVSKPINKDPKPAKPIKDKKPAKPAKPVLPQKLVQVIPKAKPSSIQTLPVRTEKTLMRFGKPTKRLMFKIDFLLKASPTIVYHFITTPSCLVRWFCDAVDITGEYYTFSWKGNTEVAELIDDIEDERLKFQWLDGEDDDEFFQFNISTADITDETILEIQDFAWADEVEEQKELWRIQIDRLRKETGDA